MQTHGLPGPHDSASQEVLTDPHAAAILPLVDASPSKVSLQSADWCDAELQDGLAVLGDGLAIALETLMDVEACLSPIENKLLPVCGLRSHEHGIQILRACLAAARGDLQYGMSELQTAAPVWGGNDDWTLLRSELVRRLAPGSKGLPEEVMAVPAAFFRDPEFCLPDPQQDCVLVNGGVVNVEGVTSGCHFMPLLHKGQVEGWHCRASVHQKWKDMVLAVEGRGNDLVLLDTVREAGDCYFHSLLIGLHFRGVLLQPEQGHSSPGNSPQLEDGEVMATSETPRAAATDAAATCESDAKGAPRGTPTKTQTTSAATRPSAQGSSQNATPPVSQRRSSTSPVSSQEPSANRRGLRFDDALAEERLTQLSMQDPIATLVASLKAVPDVEAFEDLLFPDRIFEDLRSKEETYNSVKRNLKLCWEDTRTHRQIAIDEDFDFRLCAPAPIAGAVHTVARAKGIQTEALLACVESNIGFLEANGTTLCHNPRAKHFISPSSHVIVGSPSSTRKTALIQQSDDWMCNSAHAGQAFQDRSILTTDSATKGIRNCLKDYGRCGVTSDEAANTFDTKMSDREAGIHFISMTKLNTWTQSEYDGPTTGNGSFTLSNYSFMLKVAGQTEVVEEIVHPKVHGFQKRVKQVWSLAETPTHDQQLFQASDLLIQDWHDWMHLHCTEQPPVVISLDGKALSMYNAAKQAITDFLAETKMPPVFRTKLVFFHSDVLRDAHKVFRAAQFLRGLCPNLPPETRLEMSLDEFTVALHKWIRQVQWHFGSYRFAAAKKDEAASGLQSNKNAESKQILCGFPEAEEQEPLDTDALFYRTLIHKTPNDVWFTSADVRLWLRNLRGTTFKDNLSQKIDKGLAHLLDHGLLQAGEADVKKGAGQERKLTARAAMRASEDPKAAKTGRLVCKRSAQSIEDDPKATAEQKRLRLSMGDFPA
eukprot:Skav202548  [mRNA]  locus=scaffold2011:358482:361283:- [translate_table: standard]